MYMFVRSYVVDVVHVDTTWIVPSARLFHLPSGVDSSGLDPKRETTLRDVT